MEYPIADKNPNSQIRYRNKQKLSEKIEKMRKGGLENFQILADYDRTISATKSAPSFGVIRDSDETPSDFTKELRRYFKYYYPLEKRQGIKYEEKALIVEEWV